MFDELRDSYPATIGRLSGRARSFVDQLPAEYQQFLTEHNGGFADEFRYTFATGVPFKTETANNPSRDAIPLAPAAVHQ